MTRSTSASSIIILNLAGLAVLGLMDALRPDSASGAVSIVAIWIFAAVTSFLAVLKKPS